jgi:translation initiation factor IF-1
MRFFLLIRTWIICTLLAAAAIFFGYQTVEVWSGNDRLEVNEAIQKTPKRQVNRRVTHRRNPRYNVYEVIAQKDLFASDRREKLPEKSPTPSPVKAAQPLDKRFALFGIVINGGEKKALVANLDKKSAKEKAYIWVKVGDKIGTLNVSEIQPEQIILTQGGRTYTIRLSDQSESQRRVRGRKKKKPTEPRTTIIKKQKVKRPAPKG